MFCSDVPVDLTLQQYVTPLAAPEDAIREARRAGAADGRLDASKNVLLDPDGVLQLAHDDLERIAIELADPRRPTSKAAGAAAGRLHDRVSRPLRLR